MTSPIPWASWGPQFAFHLLPGDAPPVPSDGWALLDHLPTGTVALDQRVHQTSAALAAMSGGSASPDIRVAASLAQLSLVGRIIAVTVGLAVHGHGTAGILQGHAWWQAQPGVGFPLALPASAASDAAPTLRDSWVERISDAVAARFQVSDHVVWGNVASTVQATWRTVERVSPAHGELARRVCRTLLEHPRIPPAEQAIGATFRRTSCCLLYRVAPDHQPACGDCVLRARV